MALNGPDPNPDAPTLARRTGEWHGLTLPPGGESPAPASSLAADAVPGYELLAEIGRGGMGVVYRARHLGLNRIVALKMVLAGSHARTSDLNRFRAEAEAIARLQHPNVVQVYDVGEANGLPYLSLELCAGSLADRLNGTPWPPKTAASLVATLAGAVHAAHQAGVLHRDIKPANVLMSLVPGPLSLAENCENSGGQQGANDKGLGTIPKITDFGLAKRLDGSGAGPTATGAILGTPSYMAPEQAGRRSSDGRAATAGPAIDIYALGAILYELLTGRPPFLAASPLDTLLQVTRDEPVPPARLSPKMPRDIQTICLKCLEKEPSRRYATAATLADDLHHYLSEEPIAARPAARWERAWKWAKRRPAQAGLIAVSAVALIALVAGSWYFTGQLQIERDSAMAAKDEATTNAEAAIENARLAEQSAERAEAEALKARRNSYALAMGQAQLAWQQAGVDRLKNLLNGQIPKPGEENLRGFEWHYWRRMTGGAPRKLGPINENGRLYRSFGSVAYSPDGRQLAATSSSGKAFVWDVASGKLERSFPLTVGGNAMVAYRPDGKQIAFCDTNGILVYDATAGTTVWQVKQKDQVNGIAYAPDGKRLVAKIGVETRVYDAAAGALLITFAKGNSVNGGVTFSPDGRRILSAGYPSQIFDAETGQKIRDVSGGSAVAIHPSGDQIAFVAMDGAIWGMELRIVAADTGRIVARGKAHSDYGGAIAYSRDGKHLATAGIDNTIRLWDSATGKEVRKFQGSSRWNYSVAFSPDGKSLAVGTGGPVEIWPLDLEQEATTVKVHSTLGTHSLALDAATGRVFGAGLFSGMIDEGAVTKKRVALADWTSGPVCAAFSRDGKHLAVGFDEGDVALWDTTTGKQLLVMSGLRHLVAAIGFSADGRRLVAASRADVKSTGYELSAGQRPAGKTDQTIVWDTGTGKIIRVLSGPDNQEVNSVALSGNGKFLLAGMQRLGAQWLDVDTGKVMFKMGRAQTYSWTSAVAVSPDGRWAAYSDNVTTDADILLYDTATGNLAHTLVGHQRGVRKMTFSADGRRLASAGLDGTVRVWDVATGQEVLSRPAPPNVVDLGFAGDLRLSAVAADGTLRTWEGGP